MKKFKILKIISTLIIVFQVGLIAIIFISPQTASASDTYTPLNFQPQIHIPGSIFKDNSVSAGNYNATSGVMSSSLLANYIKAIYKYGLIVGGILAAVVLMGGGVLWLISAGNDSKIAQAKELITGSVVGLIILFSSWIILDTINPDLVNMKTLKTKVVNKMVLGSCCEYPDFTVKENDSRNNCENANGTYFESGIALVNTDGYGRCADTGKCYCKLGGSWSTLWLSHTLDCVDETTAGKKVTPDICDTYCSLAADMAHLSYYEIHFEWGLPCSPVPHGAGASW